jgi:hypothetical protein
VIRNTVDVYSNTPMVGSAKFNAMAGANGALGGDANSLLTNPAGLGLLFLGRFLNFIYYENKQFIRWGYSRLYQDQR